MKQETRLNIVIELLGAAVATGIALLIWKLTDLPPDDFRALLLLLVALSTLIVFLLRRELRDKARSLLAALAVGWLRDEFGLLRIYPSFDAAKERILEEFRKAADVRILIQLGRGIIGGKPALLFEPALRRREPSFRMKILYAGPDSPHLSQERAEARRDNAYGLWQLATNFNRANLVQLRKAGINVEAREHSAPYLWRLFFFDRTLFVVPYLYDEDNSLHAPVLEVRVQAEGQGQRSLYDLFARYFDDLWQASRQLPETQETAPSVLDTSPS